MRYTLESFKEATESNGYIFKSVVFTTVSDKYQFECPKCKQEFMRKGSKALLKDRTPYCRKCSCKVHAESKVKPELVTCIKCGGKKSKKRTSNFCASCWAEESKINLKQYRKSTPNFTGDKNPAWAGGGIAYWKQKVTEVGSCDICGYNGTALNAHHLYAKHTHPELQSDITNGVCLCANCHQEFHLKYGNKVTPDDYKEFKGFKNGN